MSRLHNVTEMMLGCRTQGKVHIPGIFPPEPLTMFLSSMAGQNLRLLAIAIRLARLTNEAKKALEMIPPILGNCEKWGEIDKILNDSERYPVLHEVYLIFDFSWNDDIISRPNSLQSIKDRIKRCFPKLITSRRLHLRQ